MSDFDRRTVLVAGLGAGATAFAAGPREAAAQSNSGVLPAPVTEFGVQPDFNGDQTIVIQAAIDSAAAARRPLFFPAGTYRVGALQLKPDTHLSGVHGRSVILHEGDGPFLTANVADNLRLSGLVFDGRQTPLGPDGSPAALLLAEDCQRLDIRGCEFAASSADGLRLHRCAGSVSDCRFADIRETGLFSIDAKGLEIAHNHVASCGDNGIQVWRSAEGEDATLIVHNRVERIRAESGGSGQNGNGIALFRAGSVIVQGNRISDCAFSAIRANAASNVQMIGNSCARLGEVALYAEFGFQGAVIANNIVDRAAAGISITNFKDHGGRLAVAQGNIIRNLAFKTDSEDKRGFGIAIEADGVVANNVIEEAPAIGIAIGWGASLRNVAATGNIIRNAGIGIAVSVTADAGYGYITSNMISGTKDGAIRAMDHDKALGPDLAISSAEAYRNIAVFGNVAH